jgi:hypothetical protein
MQVAPRLAMPDEVASADPDNMPPRSRLFLVVPKTAEARLIHVSCFACAARPPCAPTWLVGW